MRDPRTEGELSVSVVSGRRKGAQALFDLWPRSLVPSDQASGEQLAQTIPDSRISLDVNRSANQQHEQARFDLFHGDQ
jgi:hypothetical protein